jgi:hypothetical protein
VGAAVVVDVVERQESIFELDKAASTNHTVCVKAQGLVLLRRVDGLLEMLSTAGFP